MGVDGEAIGRHGRFMPPLSRRPTQKQVAALAGVTQSTVSLVLRNDPAISAETKRRVNDAMEKLGYVPDPFLSGLAAYRKTLRKPTFHATLALVSTHPEPGGWRGSPQFNAYWEGAVAQGREMGYHLEEHSLCAPGMTPGRLTSILQSRAIRGLLLAPQQPPQEVPAMDWSKFAVVAFGYSILRPVTHVVTVHQYRAMETAFRKCLELGYKRPGLAMSMESDERAKGMWSAAFWKMQNTRPASRRVKPFMPVDLTFDGLVEWADRHRPDVVISIDPRIETWLVKSGRRVPEDIGFVHLSVPLGEPRYAGISENPMTIGRKGMALLIGMVQHGEIGLPEVPNYLLVEGTWRDGRTVRRVDA
jgi:Transcriptional regulators